MVAGNILNNDKGYRIAGLVSRTRSNGGWWFVEKCTSAVKADLNGFGFTGAAVTMANVNNNNNNNNARSYY